jgi:AsmA protein
MMSSPPPRHDPRPPARRKRRWLRGLAWTIGGIGVLAAAGIAALITFAPVGMIREQVIREVKVQTGRDLVVAGRTSLSIFPSLALTMGNVSLSAPPGMGGAPFVQMRRLDVRVPLLPLLSRKVAVEQLVLSEPVFELRVDQRGSRSWDFAAFAVPPTIMVAQAPTRQGQGGGQNGGQSLPPELQEFLRNSSQGDGAGGQQGASQSGAGGRRPTVPDIALGDVRIDNGLVRYRDDRSGLAEEIRSINATVSLRSMTSPMEAKGDLALRGEKVDFTGRIASPKALIEERPSRVALAIASARGTARLDGTVSSVRGTTQIDGKIEMDTRSVRGLAGWLGANPAAGPGLGPLRLEGDLKSGPTWVALNNTKGRLDDIAGSGSITVDFVGGRPSVKGDVRLGAVDLNSYLYGDAATGAASPGAATPGAAAPPGPQVKGFERRSGWSEQPFDLAPLSLIDGDLRVSMASVVWREINVGATQLGVALKNRTLRATIEDIRLYGGQGRGLISVEPAGPVAGQVAAQAAVGVNLSFDGVNGLPLLKDAAGFDWIDGKARIQILVGGTGVHERGVMETLSGKAEFGFTDGAVIGFNLPQMIRGLSQGRLSGFSRLPTERTDFSEAGASFQIRNGIAETKDLRAVSPLLRLTGAGTANLGQRQIDATLRPRLVGSLSGQGAAAGDLSGIELPVRIRGSWEKPSIGADIDSVLKNPGQAIDVIRELGRQVQQGGGGDGVNRLIDRLFRK